MGETRSTHGELGNAYTVLVQVTQANRSINHKCKCKDKVGA
jgi:hypothetical protein